MDFKDLVHKRRSNRTLTGGKIPASEIKLILEAGLRAPNACNFQSWHFYCIVDKAKIEALVPEVCGQAWIKNSSFVVVITEDTTKLKDRWGERVADMFVAEDAGAAAQNMLLMATELGYTGCFVGAFDEDKARDFVGAKESERPVLLLPIGTYDTEPALRDRKPFEDTVTFIGEIEESDDTAKENKPFELRTASIPNAIFDDLNLANASFNNINMFGVKFTDINMTETSFTGLCMNNADFGCVDMQNAKFENPDLTGATFKNCNFKDVSLTECNIEGMTINGISVKELLDRVK